MSKQERWGDFSVFSRHVVRAKEPTFSAVPEPRIDKFCAVVDRGAVSARHPTPNKISVANGITDGGGNDGVKPQGMRILREHLKDKSFGILDTFQIIRERRARA